MLVTKTSYHICNFNLPNIQNLKILRYMFKQCYIKIKTNLDYCLSYSVKKKKNQNNLLINTYVQTNERPFMYKSKIHVNTLINYNTVEVSPEVFGLNFS